MHGWNQGQSVDSTAKATVHGDPTADLFILEYLTRETTTCLHQQDQVLLTTPFLVLLRGAMNTHHYLLGYLHHPQNGRVLLLDLLLPDLLRGTHQSLQRLRVLMQVVQSLLGKGA